MFEYRVYKLITVTLKDAAWVDSSLSFGSELMWKQCSSSVSYRESRPCSGSGHGLLLLLRGSTLHRLEVVESCGEIIHQPVLLDFLLSLFKEEIQRVRTDDSDNIRTPNKSPSHFYFHFLMLHVNTFLWRLKESLRTQAHLFGQGDGKRERAEVFQVLVGLLGQLVCVVLHLLTVNKSHTH